MWEQARGSPEPPELKEKVFVAKCKIPVLENYGGEKYPEEYWECWPSQRLEDAKVKTWVNHEELEELCEEVGITVEFGQAWVVLRDLRFGADLGAVGRSRLGSQGPNGKLALEHGARVVVEAAALGGGGGAGVIKRRVSFGEVILVRLTRPDLELKVSTPDSAQ